MINSKRIVKLTLFSSGSFSFGWILGIVLHELGHAVAMWITGGIVNRITITPFSWSYTYYGSIPKYPQFTTWAGALLGSLFGLIVLFLIRKKATPYSVPFLYLGIAPMLHGGGYYLLDTFVTKRGDASNLIRSGVPIIVVLAVGFLLAVGGIFFLIKYFYWNGLSPRDTFLHRCIVFGIGVMAYFLLGLIFSVVLEPENVMQDVIAIVSLIVFAIFVGFVSIKIPQIEKFQLPSKVQWRHVAYAIMLGVLAIVVPHLFFAS